MDKMVDLVKREGEWVIIVIVLCHLRVSGSACAILTSNSQKFKEKSCSNVNFPRSHIPYASLLRPKLFLSFFVYVCVGEGVKDLQSLYAKEGVAK